MSQAITVILAVMGFGVLSFVLPTPGVALARAVFFWLLKPVRLENKLRIKQVKFLLANGLSILGSRLSSELMSQGDYAVLGLMATHSQVGLYFFAFQLSAQPLWTLAGNFSNVLFPALVQLRTDTSRQLAGAFKAANLLSYLILPICFLQAAMSGPFLVVFFGQKWVGSIRLAQFLSIGLAFDAVTWVAAAMINARREYNFGLALLVARLPIFFLFVWLGALFAKETGVAIGVMIYHLLQGPIVSTIIFARYGARVRDVARLYVRPALFAASAVLTAFAISLVPWLMARPAVRLIELLVLGMGLYLGLMRRFEPAVLAELGDKLGVNRVMRRFRRFDRAGLR